VTAKECNFDENTILVSKTDLQGKITYANQAFINISGFSEKELIGSAHNIARHPEMPATVFKLLWEYLKEGKEINAYVLNQCKNGDYYWVFANVTPSIDLNNKTIAYHSTRCVPSASSLSTIVPLYAELLALEKSSGIDASYKHLKSILQNKGLTYDEFILSC